MQCKMSGHTVALVGRDLYNAKQELASLRTAKQLPALADFSQLWPIRP